jgi:heptosyltransferase-1
MMRVLIIRLSAIGDVFFCTALLDALKRQFPGCEVTWLTEPIGGQILAGHPQVDRLLVLPRAEWTRLARKGALVKLGRELMRFVQELRRHPFDLVLDPQGIFKSAVWARMARAELRVGVNGADGSACLYDALVRVPRMKEPPMLSEYRLLVRGLGGDPDAITMRLHVDEQARGEAEAWLCEKRPIVLCPFTTRPQKHWPDSHWSELGDRLAAAGLGPVLILGGPADGPRAECIAGAMGKAPLVSAGERRSIPFALAILERARAVIGVDTGLTHAGIALGRPTLALFGSTRPYVRIGMATARVLYTDLPCAPCRRHPTCEGRFDCMRQLAPRAVEAALKALLGK